MNSNRLDCTAIPRFMALCLVLFPVLQLISDDSLPNSATITVISRNLQPDEFLFAHAKVNMHDAVVILDTGASCNVVNSRACDWLLDSIGVANATLSNGRLVLSKHPPCKVSLNGIKLAPGDYCLSTPLDHLESSVGRKIDAVFGIQSLSDHILELSFSTREAKLIEGMLQLTDENAVRLKHAHNDLIVIPHVNLGDREAEDLIIDTGSNYCLVLTDSLFEKLLQNRQLVDSNGGISVDGKSQYSCKTGRIKVINFAGNELTDLPVVSGPKNTVGMRFLRRFDIKLDA